MSTSMSSPRKSSPAWAKTWIAYKRKEEADEVRMRPHPWEFALYYDT
jgi:glutamine synthetase